MPASLQSSKYKDAYLIRKMEKKRKDQEIGQTD